MNGVAYLTDAYTGELITTLNFNNIQAYQIYKQNLENDFYNDGTVALSPFNQQKPMNNGYNNNGNNYGNNYGRNNYNRNNGGNNYNHGSSNQQRKKHSGAKMRTSKSGNPTVFAWNYSRRFGMVKLSASPFLSNKNDKQRHGLAEGQPYITESKSKRIYERYLGHLSVPMQPVKLVTCWLEQTTGKLYLSDGMNMVASTRAPNGGYFGKSSKPTR
ncbi:MAG: hypothetical protein V4613_03625 [Bacteroidota bacterium]